MEDFPRNNKTTSVVDLNLNEKKKRKIAKNAVNDRKDEEEMQIFKQPLKPLTVNELSKGSLLLGSIAEIHKNEMVISLPFSMVGFIRKEQTVEDGVIRKNVEEVIELSKIFQIGDLVLCVILSNESSKLVLSMRPSLLNAGLSTATIKPNLFLAASIKSIEDHGYLLSFGIQNFTAFLPLAECKEKKFHLHQILYVQVTSVNEAARAAICTVASPDTHVPMPHHQSFGWNALKAGMLFDGRITDVVRSVSTSSKESKDLKGSDERLKEALPLGLRVSVCNILEGYVPFAHMCTANSSQTSANEEECKEEYIQTLLSYKPNQKIVLRMIAVVPATRQLLFSALPHIIQWVPLSLDVSQFPVGLKISNAEVIQFQSRYCMWLYAVVKLGSDPEAPKQPVLSVCNINRISDNKVKRIEDVCSIHQKFNERVLFTSQLEGMLIVSCQPSVLEETRFCASDFKPGDITSGTIQSIRPHGLIVTLSPFLTGFVHKSHLTDVPLDTVPPKFKVKNPLRVRILHFNSKQRMLTATAKKSIVKDTSFISDFDRDVKVGVVAMGYISKVVEQQDGSVNIILHFGGDLMSSLSTEDMKRYIEEKRSLKVGSLLKIRITKVYQQKKKFNISTQLQLCAEEEAKAIYADLKKNDLSIGSTCVQLKLIAKSTAGALVSVRPAKEDVNAVDDSTANTFVLGFIPKMHLADDAGQASRILQHIKMGYEFPGGIVLSTVKYASIGKVEELYNPEECGEVDDVFKSSSYTAVLHLLQQPSESEELSVPAILLSVKPSLLCSSVNGEFVCSSDSLETPPYSPSSTSPQQLRYGYVRRIGDYGCLISFGNWRLTGIAAKHFLLDKFVEDESHVHRFFKEGQTVRGYVHTFKGMKEGGVQCSSVSDVGSSGDSRVRYSVDLRPSKIVDWTIYNNRELDVLRSYFKREVELVSWVGVCGAPKCIQIGGLVGCKVLAKKEFGLLVQIMEENDWIGIVLMHQRGDVSIEGSSSSVLEVGDVTKGVILDLDATNKIVDVCCKKEIVEGVSDGMCKMLEAFKLNSNIQLSVGLMKCSGEGELMSWSDTMKLKRGQWSGLIGSCEKLLNLIIAKGGHQYCVGEVQLCKSLYSVISINTKFRINFKEGVDVRTLEFDFPLLLFAPAQFPNIAYPAQPDSKLIVGVSIIERLKDMEGRLLGLADWKSLLSSIQTKNKREKRSGDAALTYVEIDKEGESECIQTFFKMGQIVVGRVIQTKHTYTTLRIRSPSTVKLKLHAVRSMNVKVMEGGGEGCTVDVFSPPKKRVDAKHPLKDIVEGKMMRLKVLDALESTKTTVDTQSGDLKGTAAPKKWWNVETCIEGYVERSRDLYGCEMAVVLEVTDVELSIQFPYTNKVSGGYEYGKVHCLNATQSIEELQQFGCMYTAGDVIPVRRIPLPVCTAQPVCRISNYSIVDGEWEEESGGATAFKCCAATIPPSVQVNFKEWEAAVLNWVEWRFPFGCKVVGRVEEILKNNLGVIVLLHAQPKICARLHVTELSNNWKNHLLNDMNINVGDFLNVCIINKVTKHNVSPFVYLEVSLRTIHFVKEVNHIKEEDALVGPIDINSIKVGNCYPGFVVSSGVKGVFICISYRLTVRVKLRELTSRVVDGVEATRLYPVGTYVSLVAITEVHSERGELEGSIQRTRGEGSVVCTPSGGYALQQLEYSALKMQESVCAQIKRVTTSGVFVRLCHYGINSVCLEALCRWKDVDSSLYDDEEKSLKVLREGDIVMMVITGLDDSRHRIYGRLDVDCMNGVSGDVEGVVEREREVEEVVDVGVNSTTMKRSFSDVLNENWMTSETSRNGISNGNSWGWEDLPKLKFDSTEVDNRNAEISDEETTDDKYTKRKSKRQKIAEKKRMDEETYKLEEKNAEREWEKDPKSAEDFERLILSKPNSSEIWIRYMAFYVSLSEMEKARDIAERALKRISSTEEKEKYNIWIAFLNMECGHGGNVEGVFRRAVQHNNSKRMHIQMTYVYERNAKLEKAKELCEEACKKFASSKKVWSRLFDLLFRVMNDVEAGRKALTQSLHRLPKHKHIFIITCAARNEYKYGSIERGQTYFDKLLAEHPKRSDLWSQYLDATIVACTSSERRTSKLDVPTVRHLFKRIIHSSFKPRSMKMFFSRWLAFEKEFGSAEDCSVVQQKAVEYVEAFEASRGE